MEYPTNLPQNTEKEILVFSLKDKVYGVESSKILEIIKFIELERPEKLPHYVAGIIKYDSFYINVIDLKILFGIETENYSSDNKILIVSSGDSVFGLIVDSIIDIKRINESEIQISPFSNNFSYSAAFCEINGKNITILNLNTIDNKIKTSIEDGKSPNFALDLYPKDEKEIQILKDRKLEFQKKDGINELLNYCIEQDAISFEIDGSNYCVEISSVKNFYKLKSEDSIVKLPIPKDYIMGLLNIRGEFTTIVDLQKFLKLGKTEIKKSSIVIILHADDFNIGILADKISDKIDIQNELELYRLNPKKDETNELFDIVKDEKMYTVIIPNKLFSAEKFQT